ncbi:phosphatidate cytidylyltransferase [Bacillus smithii]|uniref:phosphatidate cytidylyltransferase n=1 Tax=Bacillus smithii TaxID=1479 RepID=UPI002E1E2C3C|nr:phosphatidate cytidylyltransferase [Bacillus smithii]
MKQRFITGVIAAAIFLPIVLYGGWPFLILTYLMASVGLYEALKMKKIRLLSLESVIPFIMLWLLLIPNRYENLIEKWGYHKLELLLFLVLIYLMYTVVTKNRFTFDDAAFAVLSALYVGFGFYYLIETRNAGVAYVFLALFIIWATDIGAYLIGRSFGKKKLWPEISPKKTVEGFFGGILSACVVAFVFAFSIHLEVPLAKLLIAALVMAVFGQIGDLVESALKRHYNIKDSGNILPGHGGILDRCDSWLFVLPLIHIFHII